MFFFHFIPAAAADKNPHHDAADENGTADTDQSNQAAGQEERDKLV